MKDAFRLVTVSLLLFAAMAGAQEPPAPPPAPAELLRQYLEAAGFAPADAAALAPLLDLIVQAQVAGTRSLATRLAQLKTAASSAAQQALAAEALAAVAQGNFNRLGFQVAELERRINALTQPAAFPVMLWGLPGSPPGESSVSVTAVKPPDAQTATLTMQIFDADMPDEGELFVNGQGPLALFGDQARDENNNLSVTITMTTPAEWWTDGPNTLRWVWRRTRGFNVETFAVEFSQPAPEPPPVPAAAAVPAGPESSTPSPAPAAGGSPIAVNPSLAMLGLNPDVVEVDAPGFLIPMATRQWRAVDLSRTLRLRLCIAVLSTENQRPYRIAFRAQPGPPWTGEQELTRPLVPDRVGVVCTEVAQVPAELRTATAEVLLYVPGGDQREMIAGAVLELFPG